MQATSTPGSVRIHEELTPASVSRPMPTATSARPTLIIVRAGTFAPSCAVAPDTNEHDHRARQVDEAGLDRRQAEDLLQVQRRVEEDREERGRDRERGDLRAGERRVAEELQREHRLLARAPRRSTNAISATAAPISSATICVAGPAELVAAQEREDEQEQAGGQRDLAGPVDAVRARVARLLDLRARDPQAEQADRQVDQEDPLPVEAAGEQAADQRADRERSADRRAVGGQRAGALTGAREGMRQQRERDGEHDRRADALRRRGRC